MEVKLNKKTWHQIRELNWNSGTETAKLYVFSVDIYNCVVWHEFVTPGIRSKRMDDEPSYIRK